MKRKTKRIIFLALLGLLVAAGVAKAWYPQVWDNLFRGLEGKPVVEKVTQSGEEYAKELDDILGEKVEDVNTQLETQGNLSVQTMVEKVVNDTEIIKEIQTRVETKVIEKTQEVQDLPQAAIDEIRRQVRAEFRRQICEEWLEGE